MHRPAAGNAQAEFARQMAERNEALRPQKKHKTSAPKGSKLAAGYVDRALLRQDDTDDEREAKLKALEQALKSGEIDRQTYDERRFAIAGGSLDSTHLVKGLDFKLLERIRRGEDVRGNKAKDEQPEGGGDSEDDVDDEFAELEQLEVHAVEKEQARKKKGQFSTEALKPGKKRSRNQILAELKASREAAKAQQQSSLGSGFKRIDMNRPKPGTTRMERDARGREVLIIVDEDGNEKRKVRKRRAGEEEEAAAAEAEAEADTCTMMPDPNAKPLGMEVPEAYRKAAAAAAEEDKDVDIFDDVGDDYDPLAGMDGSDSDSSDGSDGEANEAKGKDKEAAPAQRADDTAVMGAPAEPGATAAARNYFKDAKTGLLSERAAWSPAASEAEMMAAIKRAAALRPVEGDDEAQARDEARARDERRRQLLASSARDDEDLDMGFGTSRLEDEEEEAGGERVRLSTWGDEDGGTGGGRGGGQKRKRGPKKRKGDANSAADVLRVMEQQRKRA